MRFASRLAMLILCATLAATGCNSRPASQTPVTPNPLSQQISQATSPAPGGDHHYLWGYQEILIDPNALTSQVLPDRGATDHWNVLKWLEQSPCSNCLRVTGIVPTPKQTLQVSVEIIHPFPNSNLTGFDVRGIAMSFGSCTFPVSGLVTSSRLANQAELVNADGFTHLYYPTTMGSGPGELQGYIQGKFATIPYANTTLNGYKRLISPGAANTRNAFYAGTSINTIFELYKPSGQFILGYAVDACWAPPTKNPVQNPITDFPPEANCPEPWRVDVSETPVGIGLTDQGGQTKLTINVYDWQGKLSYYAPWLECPNLFDGKQYATFLQDGNGFTQFTATVENKKLAANGWYKCLVGVKDTAEDTAPSWLDLTAYQIHELGVGMQAPGIVTGFQASDGDPSLPDRKVQLTWDALPGTIDWYDIERLDYVKGTGWTWELVKSSPGTDTSWLDGNPRYCGPDNAIQYRISARNSAGSSPAYATDTGYPKPRGVYMAMWCTADDSSGTNASTTWARANQDFTWCNQFWNRYGLNFVLKNSGAFFWVGDPQYRNLTGSKANDMHNAYGKVQHGDSVNVYYVDSSEGESGGAFTETICPSSLNTTQNIFIVLSKNSSGPPPNGIPITLSHECGHAVGRFWDEYLLDGNGDMILNDSNTCSNTDTWCSSDTYPLFCDPGGCYAQNPNANKKTPWNLMWYSMQGFDPTKYNILDTQSVWMANWLQNNKNNYPMP